MLSLFHCRILSGKEWILNSLGPHTSQEAGNISLSLPCNLSVDHLVTLILSAVIRSLYCEVAIFLFVISKLVRTFSRQLFQIVHLENTC